MIWNEDTELRDWITNAENRGGGFIRTIAEAAMRADAFNYAIIRPAILLLTAKYPEYDEQ